MDAPFSLLKRDEAGGILAACRAQIDGPLVHLSDLWVAPEARHRGEGRALVTQLLDEARTRGAERALATTATPEAGSFVQALGFERVLDVPPGAPERVIWSHRL
ncbi:MAG: GNAT family N-acetyltransferase [Pseudomonadota bacterium]